MIIKEYCFINNIKEYYLTNSQIPCIKKRKMLNYTILQFYVKKIYSHLINPFIDIEVFEFFTKNLEQALERYNRYFKENLNQAMVKVLLNMPIKSKHLNFYCFLLLHAFF